MADLTTFKEAVAAAVVGCNPTVLDRVVQHYAEQEAQRRIPLLMSGLAKEDELIKAVSKFRATKTFNEDGSVASEFWTQADIEGKKKANENLTRLRDALTSAIVEGKYDALEKTLKSGNQNQKAD